MTLHEIDGMHIYEIDGKRYPSVTTILQVIAKPELLKFYGDYGTLKAEEYRDQAGAWGTARHNDAARIAYGEIDFSKSAQPYQEWFHTNITKVQLVETQIVNKKWGYAGTLDLVATYQDYTRLMDLKTSSEGMKPEYPLQLAAYRNALPDRVIHGTGIIHMPRLKNNSCKHLPKCHFHPTTMHPVNAWRGFLAAALLWWQTTGWQLDLEPPEAFARLSG